MNKKPESGIFLKTSIEEKSGQNITLFTGIGKFFVPEGSGRVLERLRGEVEVHARLDRFGTAKIVDIYHEGEKLVLEAKR